MFQLINCEGDVHSPAKGYNDSKALDDHNLLFNWLTD